jgi:molybdenum cofactor cytidylyltransferase
MGETSPPKLLLPLADGRSVLRHAAENALALVPSEIIVVVRPDLPAVQESLEGLSVSCVVNPRYAEGMGTSLAAGVKALSEASQAALVMLADEPVVETAVVWAIVDAYLRHGKPIITPMYGETLGPPTLFARTLFTELAELEGDTGGRQVIARHPDFIHLVHFPSGSRPRDVDTLEDYQSILREPKRES